jgi:hypothetical protein
MVDFKRTPVLQPKDFFAEEIAEESFHEDLEVIFLEFSTRLKVVEKKKRLTKDWGIG